MEIVIAIIVGVVLGFMWHSKHPATKKCEYCRRTIDWHAVNCPYCTRHQNPKRTGDGLFLKCMLCILLCVIAVVVVFAGLGIYT